MGDWAKGGVGSGLGGLGGMFKLGLDLKRVPVWFVN